VAKKAASKKTKKPPKAQNGIWEKIVARYKEIGPIRSGLSAAITAAGGASPLWLTESRRLRVFIVAGVAIGAVAGYLLSPFGAVRKPKTILYGSLLTLGFLGILGQFVTVNPANQWQSSVMQSLQDFSMTNPEFFNTSMAVLYGAVIYSVVTLICIAARKGN